jgi:hypothetical protein
LFDLLLKLYIYICIEDLGRSLGSWKLAAIMATEMHNVIYYTVNEKQILCGLNFMFSISMCSPVYEFLLSMSSWCSSDFMFSTYMCSQNCVLVPCIIPSTQTDNNLNWKKISLVIILMIHRACHSVTQLFISEILTHLYKFSLHFWKLE